VQLVYLPMLFLSGATFPLTMLPNWVQVITQFVPATYLTLGLSRILQGGESLAQNWKSVVALIIAAIAGLTIATKLFRWEKEEKLRPAAKLWVVVVILPFLFLGIYQAWSKQEITKAKILDRQMERGRTWLVQNARIFVGNGKVIESGSVLIKQGRIAEVYDGPAPTPESLRAKVIDAAGKTVLPGLIDMHVHLGATGGFYQDPAKAFDPKNLERELVAYLYCGVTAVRSAGDPLDKMIELRQKFGTGEKLGAELFFCGPLFTTEGGHGTEYARFMPETMRASFLAQFVRLPKTPVEAKSMVDEVAGKGVDAIKGVLESGVPEYSFNRMDVNLLRAVGEEAHAKRLPLSVHTGKAIDVDDAISVGADSIEHGSFIDEISDNGIDEMKTRGIVLDPTLSVAEGLTSFSKGDTTLLERSLVEQVTTKELLSGSEKAATAEQYKGLREGLSHYPISEEIGARNLLKAWHAGVMLVTGSDAGNFYVLHGPTVQHEIELWVAAGIPIEVALEGATYNAAKLLRADNRIGTLEKGKEASLFIVDGNPLQDMKTLSSISTVFCKGERVTRSDLFEQEQ
jgi:imidazolonepropionase-like amidohydrolase